LKKPVLGEVSEVAIESANEWDKFCDAFFKTFQNIARLEVQQSECEDSWY
jgi:hypothetical protein